MTLRLAVGRINSGMPTRSPPCTSTSASANDTTSARSSLLHSVSAGGELHRGRTVGPDPDRVRGFPFALAHIEMIVARRAPPVDVLRRLAGHEVAVLPEILAGAGAAAAVQAVNDGRRRRGALPESAAECARRACGFCRRPPGPRSFSLSLRWRLGHSLSDARLQPLDDVAGWSRLRRGRRRSAPCGA